MYIYKHIYIHRYRFVPGSGYVNGPVWFIVTLFWLWVFFPYLLKPVKTVFANCSWGDFLMKLGLLWLVSLLPWAIIDKTNLKALRWGLRCFPILRIPEFVIGMAIAIRVNKDKEEMDEMESKGEQPSCRPGVVAGVGPIIALILAGSYYLWKLSILPDDCECLPGDNGESFYHCFGWWEKFDTKFVPISALMIFSVTTLDVAAHRNDGQPTYDAAVPRVGQVGACIWFCLCLEPFVKLGKWGLPIFLWQSATNVITQVTIYLIFVTFSFSPFTPPLIIPPLLFSPLPPLLPLSPPLSPILLFCYILETQDACWC